VDIKKIIKIIAEECENGCTDFLTTIDYFSKHYAEEVDPIALCAVATSLDYDGVRRNKVFLQLMTFKA